MGRVGVRGTDGSRVCLCPLGRGTRVVCFPCLASSLPPHISTFPSHLLPPTLEPFPLIRTFPVRVMRRPSHLIQSALELRNPEP